MPTDPNRFNSRAREGATDEKMIDTVYILFQFTRP